MSKPQQARLEHAIRIFLQLLDLSLDLERNEDDASFRDKHGSIHYLYDADIFEIFIDATDPRGRAASLHAESWSMERIDPRQQAPWTQISAQTALSTAEYILCGSLPGQRSDSITMSYQHRWELARRLDKLAKDFVDQIDLSDSIQAAHRVTNVKVFEDNLNSVKPDWDQLRQLDTLLAFDLRAIMAKGPKPKSLSRFIRTRLLCRAIARGDSLEKAEQITRIVSSPFRRRFETVHQKYTLKKSDTEKIAADAQFWFQRLLKEATLKKIRISSTSSAPDSAYSSRAHRRTRAAVWDDAQSLATIRWVAKNNSDSQARYAFITADNLLFDCYRRWYASLKPTNSEYSEPFILRRIAQFAPMFNFFDAGAGDTVEVKAVFSDLKRMIEINSFSLNFSVKSGELRSATPRIRELIALRQTDTSPIISDPDYADLVETLTRRSATLKLWRMNDVLDKLRGLERAALGFVDTHMLSRLDERQKQFAELSGASDNKPIMLYVGRLLHSMLSVSRNIWLPLARDAIDAWIPNSSRRFDRAPVSVNLKIVHNDGTLDVGDAIRARLERPEEKQPLLPTGFEAFSEDDEALIFAVASVIALISGDWSNAGHFAEMAKTTSANVKNERAAEYLYLSAISRRFKIGAHGVPLTADAEFRMLRGFAVGKRDIERCIEFYRAQDQTIEVQKLLVRSLSELAALRLFVVAAVTLALKSGTEANIPNNKQRGVGLADSLNQSLLGRKDVDFARTLLHQAEMNLIECMAMERSLAAGEMRKAPSDLLRIRGQYLTNWCSASVLRHLLCDIDGEDAWLASDDSMREAVLAFLSDHDTSTHPLMKAEMFSFLGLCGDKAAFKNVARISDPLQGALALDRAMLHALRELANRYLNPSA